MHYVHAQNLFGVKKNVPMNGFRSGPSSVVGFGSLISDLSAGNFKDVLFLCKAVNTVDYIGSRLGQMMRTSNQLCSFEAQILALLLRSRGAPQPLRGPRRVRPIARQKTAGRKRCYNGLSFLERRCGGETSGKFGEQSRQKNPNLWRGEVVRGRAQEKL